MLKKRLIQYVKLQDSNLNQSKLEMLLHGRQQTFLNRSEFQF
jgi:hypothetical protein